jgi:hypothetical protein
MFAPWKRSSTFRRSKRSARTPAGSANARFGIVLRKPITPRVAADPPRSRTTYPNAPASIQLPVSDRSTPLK